MFMARASERLTADAYTRASVEAYLRAVSDERTRLELAIAEQVRRRDAARAILERLDAIPTLPSAEPDTAPVSPGGTAPATVSTSTPGGRGD